MTEAVATRYLYPLTSERLMLTILVPRAGGDRQPVMTSLRCRRPSPGLTPKLCNISAAPAGKQEVGGGQTKISDQFRVNFNCLQLSSLNSNISLLRPHQN